MVEYIVFIGEDGPLFFDAQRMHAEPIQFVLGDPRNLPEMLKEEWDESIDSKDWDHALERYTPEDRANSAIYRAKK